MQQLHQTQLESALAVDRLVTIFDLPRPAGHIFQPEVHDFWELVFVRRGTVHILRDGRPCTAQAGEMLAYAPGVVHGGRVGGADVVLQVVSFACASPRLQVLRDMQRSLAPGQRAAFQQLIRGGVPLFERTRPETGESGLRPREGVSTYQLQQLKNQLELFLIDLCAGVQAAPLDKAMLVEAVRRYFAAHLAAGLTLQQVAGHFSVSVSQLKRAFRQENGQGAMACFAAMRMQRACLLLDSGYNATEVAMELGFASSQHFHRVFKAHTGKTPGEYAGGR